MERRALQLVALVCFFFQAEDGIRDVAVTGVQTCALPILQNRAGGQGRRLYGLLAAFVAGILIQNVAIMGIEQIAFPNSAHNGLYYKVAGAAFPIALLAMARASRVRWGATAAAAAYMAISLVMIWILQLFPATPKLAPVFNPVTHMVAPPFPLLLVVPSVALDLLVQRFGPGRDWWVAVLAGAVFVGVFFATQWLFSEFLLTPHARTFFFGVDQWDYSSRLGPWRYRFWRIEGDPVTAPGLAIAGLLAIVSAWGGLLWGHWMARVRRCRAPRRGG